MRFFNGRFTGRSSLSADFFLFSSILLTAVVVVSVGFWVQVYDDEVNRKREQLPAEVNRVDSLLTDSVDYTSKYAQFIGEQIVQHNPKDLNYIATLISGRSTAEPQHQDLYATTFDWVTPDGQLRASSKIGVLRKPFDMSSRDYLARTRHDPWTVQLSKLRFGGLSQKWIIPAGMGLTDATGHFLGTITWGISIDALTRRLAQVMGPTDIRYLILTDDLKLVLDSAAGNAGPDPAFSLDLSGRKDFITSGTGTGYFAHPIVYQDINFSYYKKVNKYPYVILVGYNTSLSHTLFNQIVLSRIAGFFGIGTAALVVLYWMRRRLVKPVMQLANMTDHIIRGGKVAIPQNGIREIDLLGKHLQKISDYIENEHRITNELALKTKALEAANAEALEACETAKKADRAKSEFLANMSHELRTPMNAVIGLTNILLSGNYPPAKQKEYLNVMHTSAEYLLQLINDLLDVARLEAGQVPLEAVAFNLEELVQEVISINASQAQQKGLVLRLDKQSSLPDRLLGDPFRLRQVLMNLIGNAVKFTPAGSVTVRLECQHDQPTDRYRIRLAVVDSGIGIPQDKLGSIFQKFTQADSSISRNYGGTGLGLSISKTLVELMEGTMSVQSELGKGSTFLMELLLPAAQEEASTPASTQLSPVDTVANPTGHVLLVEDNKGNILVATSILEMHGYSYELAGNGREALQKLSQPNFDVVLMDVQMPVMDGFEVTRYLREREKSLNLPRIPVIGMTAHALVGDRQRCIQAGMDDYIAKPFNHEELAMLLQRMILEKKVAAKPLAA